MCGGVTLMREMKNFISISKIKRTLLSPALLVCGPKERDLYS